MDRDKIKTAIVPLLGATLLSLRLACRDVAHTTSDLIRPATEHVENEASDIAKTTRDDRIKADPDLHIKPDAEIMHTGAHLPSKPPITSIPIPSLPPSAAIADLEAKLPYTVKAVDQFGVFTDRQQLQNYAREHVFFCDKKGLFKRIL